MGWARWATRVRHLWSDAADLVTFSFCPLKTWSTKLQATSSRTITLEQWPGADVGSGGVVWGGARRLASHLREHGDGCAAVVTADAAGARTRSPAIEGRNWSQLSVLELGAGTGALGLVAAALGARSVTLTDQAAFVYPAGIGGGAPKEVAEGRTLLDLMRRNVRAFTEGTQGAYCLPEVREMVWGGGPEMREGLQHPRYDVICASDVLLFERAHFDLVRTLRALSGADTVVLIEHTDRLGGDTDQYPQDLLAFLRALEADALWTPLVVRDHGRHLTLRLARTLAGAPPFAVAAMAPRSS